jgi:hypothetical protein
MKNKIFYGFIIGITMNLSCTKPNNENLGNAENDSTYKLNETPKPTNAKYDIPSGIIFYSIEGAQGKGTKKVYFEEYGKKEATEIYKNGVIIEKLINKGNDSLYTLDFENKTAIKRKSSMNGTEQRFDIEEMPEDMKKENKITRMEDEKIAGKICKSYSMESGGIKTIKSGSGHIILMMRTEMGGTLKTLRATETKENIEIPQDVYDVPSNFTLKEF